MDANLSFCSINVHGLLDKDKRNRIFQFCKIKQFDVVFVQETHLHSVNLLQQWQRQWGDQSFWSFGSSHSAGVGILLSKNIPNISYFHHDLDGRLIVLNVTIRDVRYRFVNVYCPNGEADRKGFLLGLSRHLVGNVCCVLGGDFNFVEDLNLDKIGGNVSRGDVGLAEMLTLKRDFSLVDTFRRKYPRDKEFSWSRYDNSVSCRLDRFYISSEFVKDILTACINHNVSFSDHKPIELSIVCSPRIRGSSFWKCNVAVLKDSFLREDITNYFRNAKSVSITIDWFEKCKFDCKEIIINHSKRIANRDRKEVYFLEAQIAEYKKIQADIPCAFEEQIVSLQNELNVLLDKRAEGVKIRARVNQISNSLKPSSFCLRAERSNAAKRTISELNIGGQVINGSEQIVNVCRDFYKELLSEHPIDISLNPYFLGNLPKLSDDNVDLCEGPVTKEEVLFALKHMKSRKCPGLDGLPKEFYDEFIHLFINELVSIFNLCVSSGVLPDSQRRGVITLLCKDSAKSADLKFWRPISLLNVDYKLLSKSLTNRLGKVLHDVINIDQTCGIKGRSIRDNVHLLRNIIDYVNTKNIHCALVSLDQSKAFDRVSHAYMFAVLQSFGFGPSFCRWIELLYSNISSQVLVNGFLSDAFHVTRSVRQGCGLSPLLYVLCMEPFAIRVRSDSHIQGLKISDVECRISQYADDSTIIACSPQSISKVFLISELYGFVSGAEINKDKCKGLWLGAWRGCRDTPAGIQWTSDSLKFYGVFLGNGDSSLLNHNVALSKFCKSVDSLKLCNLDMLSKALYLNMFSCSKVWYVLPFFPLDKNYIARYTSYMFKFIWKNSTECVKRAVLFNDFSGGGIRLVSFDLKIKSFIIFHVLQWLFGDPSPKWRRFASYWLNLQLRVFYPDLTRNDINQTFDMSSFYYCAFQCFRDFVEASGGVPDGLVSVKEIYWRLIKYQEVSPVICKYRPDIDFGKVFSFILNKINDPTIRSLNWKIVHDVLPVNSVLFRFSISRDSTCYFCPRIESSEHLFSQCGIGQSIRTFIHRFMSRLCGHNCPIQFDAKLVLYNIVTLKLSRRQKDILLILVNLSKWSIWLARNKVKFEANNFSAEQVLCFFSSNLKLHVRTCRVLMSDEKFKALWIADGNNETFIGIRPDGSLFFEF